MARAGLTWTLKLNDAMSGAAKKIAASLDKVQGELEALDKAKVDGPAESVKKLQDRLKSQQQKRSDRESDRAQKSSKRIAEQIGSVEEKSARRTEEVRDRLETKAQKARARVNNQTAGQISRGETKLSEMRARYDSMAKKDGNRGVKLKQRIAAQEKIVGDLRQKTKERADAEYRRYASEASRFEEKQSKVAARTKARLEKQEAQRAERFAERSAKQSKRAQERITVVTKETQERSEKQLARKRESLIKRRDKLIERQEKESTRRAARARQGRVDAFKGAAGLYATGLVMIAGASLALGAAIAPRIIELQSFKQATKFGFEQLLKSSSEAERAWSSAQSIAESTGTSITEVAGSMNQLIAQGMGVDEVTELTKRFADLKALNPGAKIENIALAMRQIQSTGKLQGDELNQLAENSVSTELVYAQLEKRLGKSREEIIKLKEAGKISSKDALAAIKEAIKVASGGREAGAVAAEMAQKTLGGSIGRLIVQLEKLAMADNPAFAKIAEFINKIANAIESGKLQPMIDAIAKGLSDMAVALGKTGDTGGIQAVADAITGFFLAVNKTIDGVRWFSENIASMKTTISLALWPFIAIKEVIEALSSIFNGASSSIGGFESRVNSTSTTVTAAKGSIVGAFDGLLKLDGIFSSAGSNMGSALIQGIVSAISGGGGIVSSAIGAMVGEAVKQLGLGGEGGGAGGAGGGFFGAAPGGPGDAMMMGNMAGMEVRNTSNTTKQFAPNVTVNVSGGASNTGGIVGAIADTLKSLNNSFA